MTHTFFKSTLIVLLCCAFCFLPAASIAEPIEWSGSLKALYLYGEESSSRQTPESHFSSSHARLEALWEPTQNWLFESAIDYQHIWLDPADDFILTDNMANRRVDLSMDSHRGETSRRTQVDRLSLRWQNGPLDITIGRQAVGFGRILIYSPLDVIAPFAPDAIDTDIRSGIDALQSTFHYGLDGQLRGIIVWSEKNRNNSYLGTWADNTEGLDVLLLGGRLRGRNVAGLGVAGDLGTLGLKGEIVLHQGKTVGEPGGDLYDHYSIGAVEAWYRFKNGISLVSQYLYNGAGASQPEAYPEVLLSAPFQEGLTHLLGRHYLIAAPAYELHPLVTIQGMTIYNLKDESLLCRPMLDLNLSDNISLQFFWTWNIGRPPKSAGLSTLSVPQSEFGMRSNSGGAFFRWYF